MENSKVAAPQGNTAFVKYLYTTVPLFGKWLPILGYLYVQAGYDSTITTRAVFWRRDD